MNPLYILGVPLGYVMEWIYKLIPNYGWDIILFTLLINIVKTPLQLNQQKNTVRMSAFQPMIADIQKKYKDKPEKQNEEIMKLQQDFGYNPMSGCAPMLINFLVMFGVIEVVYRPLQRIFHIGTAAMNAAGDALTALGIGFTTVTRDTNIIAQVMAGESTVTSAFTADQVSTITEFGQHMDFFGIDLTRVPQYNLSADNLPLLILPILAIVTMFISTHISMESLRPADAGQHESDHVYDAPDVPVLLLYRALRVLSVLRHFQRHHDCADPGHAQDLRPRKGQGRGHG